VDLPARAAWVGDDMMGRKPSREGAPRGWEGAAGDRTTNAFLDFVGTWDGQALIMSFAKIQEVTLRRCIVDMVQRLAGLGGNEPPKVRRARPKRK
jgi:hypothetical protein